MAVRGGAEVGASMPRTPKSHPGQFSNISGIVGPPAMKFHRRRKGMGKLAQVTSLFFRRLSGRLIGSLVDPPIVC